MTGLRPMIYGSAPGAEALLIIPIFRRYLVGGITGAALVVLGGLLQGAAAATSPPTPAATVVRPAQVRATTNLGAVKVTSKRVSPLVTPTGISSAIRKFNLPQTIESISRQQIAQTTNTIDAEDALDALPSLFLRKRNNGDTQVTLETRMWGVNSSARSLVYVDNIPISALISNNNTTGAPRWGMVSPAEIKGIDVLYGPYAAEYPGNSMGAVVLITTRVPHTFEVTAKHTEAAQSFGMNGTHDQFNTSGTAVTAGDRLGRFSYFLSANREDSYSQPLSFVTAGAAPAGTVGTIPSVNKTGATADIVGAGGLLHSLQTTASGRFTFDPTAWLHAAYMIGFWNNDTNSSVQSYLSDGGQPSFGGVSRFAGGRYTLTGRQLMNALSFKTDMQGNWNWEAVATQYDYLDYTQRSPAGVLTGENFTANGYIARMNGTGWSTQDLKGLWHPDGMSSAHHVSFGLHHDLYELDNPTYNTGDWISSPDDGNGQLHTDGRGKTETYALWAQDAWAFAPDAKFTFGGRLEHWRAYDGFNLAGDVAATQPVERTTEFSPKATFSWQVDPAWSTKLSLAQAYRFPTVSELYQIVSTGDTFAVPNANLLPEHVYSGEFATAWRHGNTHLRVSLFQQSVKNALMSQTTFINNTYTRTVQNVAEIRNRGIEFVARRQNAFIPGLELSNSLTLVDSRILSDPSFENAAGTTATGKRVPYVPRWRDTLQATYRPSARMALSLAVRYQSKVYSTLDNTDTQANVFGAFDRFFVVNAHFHYVFDTAFSMDIGINNLFDEKYFEYHPFPMRTFIASLGYTFQAGNGE